VVQQAVTETVASETRMNGPDVILLKSTSKAFCFCHRDQMTDGKTASVWGQRGDFNGCLQHPFLSAVPKWSKLHADWHTAMLPFQRIIQPFFDSSAYNERTYNGEIIRVRPRV
jgi:hypothetical protein